MMLAKQEISIKHRSQEIEIGLLVAVVFLIPFVFFINIASFGTPDTLGIGTIAGMLLLGFFTPLVLHNRQNKTDLIYIILIVGIPLLISRKFPLVLIIDCYIFLLAKNYTKDIRLLRKILTSMMYSILIAAIWGIVHYEFFYTFITVDPEMIYDKIGQNMYVDLRNPAKLKETSIYFGANVFGFFIALGQNLNTFLTRNKPKWFFFSVIFLVAVLTTGSRSGLLLFFIPALLKLSMSKRLKKRQKGFLAVALGFSVVTILPILNSRFTIDAILQDERIPKVIFAFSLFASNYKYFFIGIPAAAAMSSEGISLSDNMYVNYVTALGFPLTILIIAITVIMVSRFCRAFSVMDRTVSAILGSFVLFFISGLFSSNNSILLVNIYLSIMLGSISRLTEEAQSNRSI